MTRPNCATCAHQTGARSCGYLLAETGATVWCSDIAECDHHQARSVPLHVTTLTAIFIFALLIFLIFANYTRRINVSGEIITQPHSINLFSPEQGVVTELYVDTGKPVKKGQPLYEIDVSRVTQAGNVSTTTLAAININATRKAPRHKLRAMPHTAWATTATATTLRPCSAPLGRAPP